MIEIHAGFFPSVRTAVYSLTTASMGLLSQLDKDKHHPLPPMVPWKTPLSKGL